MRLFPRPFNHVVSQEESRSMCLNTPQNELDTFQGPLNVLIMCLVLLKMISSVTWHKKKGRGNASRPLWRTLRLYSSDNSCHCLKCTSQCVSDCIFIWGLDTLCHTPKCPAQWSVTESVCGSAVVIEGTAHEAKRGQPISERVTFCLLCEHCVMFAWVTLLPFLLRDKAGKV